MYKVLIVEDDPMVAMINEQYISRNKLFSVVGKCSDGKSALEFLKNNAVDLIILDVFMPYADGFETLRQIRKNKISVDAIMVTAVKPFTFDSFRMALDKFIAQTDALKDLETLNQKNIDFIIDNSRKKIEDLHPKGIQQKTLILIMEHLKDNEDTWLTGDAIAGKVGLTGVTVRRYMNYLAETGMVIGEMNYETGGRPCMLYKIAK